MEKKRRQKAELENVLRDEMLATEVLKRTELEKDETLRQKRWAELPVHTGIHEPFLLLSQNLITTLILNTTVTSLLPY